MMEDNLNQDLQDMTSEEDSSCDDIDEGVRSEIYVRVFETKPGIAAMEEEEAFSNTLFFPDKGG